VFLSGGTNKQKNDIEKNKILSDFYILTFNDQFA